MAKAKYTAQVVAAAIAKASAVAKPDKLADEVARFLKAERLVRLWPAIVKILQRPGNSNVATVTTAQPLAEATLAKLERAWRHVEVKVQPQLLGGAVVRVGDRQVDLSIRNELRRLEAALSGSK